MVAIDKDIAAAVWKRVLAGREPAVFLPPEDSRKNRVAAFEDLRSPEFPDNFLVKNFASGIEQDGHYIRTSPPGISSRYVCERKPGKRPASLPKGDLSPVLLLLLLILLLQNRA